MKKKVLFLLEAFDKGGIEKVTLDIVNALDPEKYDITVQTFWYGGCCQSQVHDNVRVVPFFFKHYVRGVIRLIACLPPRVLHSLFVHGRYDVEIAASDGGAAKVISGGTNKKAKKIAWIHMDVMKRGSRLKEFRDRETARKIYEKFNVIACVSKACRNSFAEKFGDDYPLTVRYNPIPAEKIRKLAEEKTDIPRGPGVNFVCVGRLTEEKGFERLLAACEEIGGCYTVDIIGEGPDAAELHDLAEHLHLSAHVRLLGYRENPYPYIKRADAFLLPSITEGFPLVVGESIVLGTPVIATDCGGVREWFHDSGIGYIIENSIEGIRGALTDIIDDPGKLNEYRITQTSMRNEIDFSARLHEFEKLLED